MPTSKDFSVEDEAYLATIAAEPKMTMDEVGADIEEHGHVPVTPETATQDPFTAKGSLSYALDEALSADTDLEKTIMTRDKNDHLDSHLTNPTDDFRDETKGEVEGTTSTPQGLIQPVESNKVGEGLEPTIQQDKAVQVKDSLAEALDAITMDGAEEIEAKLPIGKDPEPDLSKYNEEEASHIPLKAPKIPPSLGGAEDTPDANGLVYVSATFTVDPDKYVSNNYRPTSIGKMPDAVAELKKASGAMKNQAANPEEEAALSDLGTPEAKESAASPDEPTPQQEEAAAKDADKEQKEEIEEDVKEEAASAIPTTKKDDKSAQDEAPEKEVLDYATFIDGSSFICYDEVADIDYSKIAMDAGPKKAPTRANCQTTFAQCRAKNPLFCRFHGPKLLEADIKTAIKATVGPGCVVQVTKDKNSKNKFTFRLTVGCPPSKKKMVEKMVHMYLTQNPGITSSTEDWNLVGKHKQTQEFEMDILQADKPPKKDTKADQMLSNTKKAIKEHKKQDVVGETVPGLEKKAAKGEKWQTVDEDIENEWADLVDKTVHKSLLGNNEEFLANFNKIANQFDTAHDAGDANGLKQALEALKDEIGKYDENGEKKPEAVATPEEQQEKAEEPIGQEGSDSQTFEYFDDDENVVSKKLSDMNSSEMSLAKNKMLFDAKENGLIEDEEDQEKYNKYHDSTDKPDAQTLSEMKEWIDGMKNKKGKKGGGETTDLPAPNAATSLNDGSSKSTEEDENIKKKSDEGKNEGSGLTDEDVNPWYWKAQKQWIPLMDKAMKEMWGTKEWDEKIAPISHKYGVAYKAEDTEEVFNAIEELKNVLDGKQSSANKSEETVLPAPSTLSKGNEGEQTTQQNQESDGALSYGGKEISSLQNELSGLKDKMQSIGATTDADVASLLGHCNLYMDDLKTAKDSLIEIENSIKSNTDDSTTNDLGKSFNMVLLDAAKKQAKEKIDEKIEGVKVAIEQFNESLQSYEKAKIETTKKGAADSVEQTVKNLGLSIFGNKRPPQGVDSVTDYLDYLKDEFESGVAGTLTPDEQSEIEDKYFLEGAYKATKAASKAMDDAIEAFKDKMDEVPSQGEDYGTYQADIEQMQKAVSSQAVEVMAAFGAYKSALEKCKYEADAAKKLAESKKKLEGGGAQGSSSGGEGETKQDLSQKVGDPYSSLQHDIKPLISNAISRNGGFTNFNTFDGTSVEGTKHFISMEKKQKEGYDEDYDEEVAPTPEELDKLLKQMNEEFSKHGLQVKPSTKMKNSGKNVYFEVEKLDGGTAKQEQEQPKKQLSDEEKKAKIAVMSPKQKVEAAVKIFKKKLAANPNDADAKAKLAKYEAMLAKLNK